MAVLGVTRPIDLARELDLTKQAINSWQEDLTKRQRDTLQAELFRRLTESGLVKKATVKAAVAAMRKSAVQV